MKKVMLSFWGVFVLGAFMAQGVYSSDYILGDLDFDGDVDGADLEIFSLVFGNTASCDNTYLHLCATSDDCTNAGGYWWSDDTCNSTPEIITGIVLNEETGQIWMDRNLGASRVATSYNDPEAYGDLYQWGRGTDGHEKRTSATTETLSSTDHPDHGDFIVTRYVSPNDWRSPQNDNLWQGVSGINNPCPAGFRLPTETELDAERNSWGSNDRAGAFASPLKLVSAGYRNIFDGTIYSAGVNGNYWSSTVSSTDTRCLLFDSDYTNMGGSTRSGGLSVRCIED